MGKFAVRPGITGLWQISGPPPLYLLHKQFPLRHSLLTGLQGLTRGQRNDPSPAGTITSTNQ